MKRSHISASPLGDKFRTFAAAYAAAGQVERAEGILQCAATADGEAAGTTTGIVDPLVESLVAVVRAATAAAERITAVADRLEEVAADVVSSRADAAPPRIEPARRSAAGPKVVRGGMPSGHRRILAALAQYGEMSRTSLAIRTRYVADGGEFSNYLSAMRTEGLIEGADLIRITEAGRLSVGQVPPAPTSSSALFNEWLSHPDMGKVHRAVLTTLRENGRLTKEALAGLTNYEVTGGGFNNALSMLRTYGLISGKSEIDLAEELCT